METIRLTQLANAAGLDRTFVGGIERAERNVSFIAISRLLDALDTSWMDFATLVDAELVPRETKIATRSKRAHGSAGLNRQS
jgi:transcriptional regulator with XRE-family HTH domain